MMDWRLFVVWAVLLAACHEPRGDGALDPPGPCQEASAEPCTTACGSEGARRCERGTWSACVASSETCDGRDDDCDGSTDEGLACALGAAESCTTLCGSTGRRRCEAGCAWSTCDAPAEICGNGVDDDCDGVVDGSLPPSTTPLWDLDRIPAFTARWEGDGAVIAWRRANERGEREIVLSRVGADGEVRGPVRPTGLVAASDEGPGWLRAASGDGPLAIGWTRARDAHVAFASADGALGAPLELARDEVGSTTWSPALAWSDGTLHAAYESRSGGVGAIVVKRFDVSGRPGAPTTVTPYEPVIGQVDIAATPGAVGAAWSAGRVAGLGYTWDLHFAVVRPSESPELVRVTEASAASNHSPSLVSDGDGFALVWAREEGERLDIVFARLDPRGARIGPERRVARARRGMIVPRLWRSGGELVLTWVEATDSRRRAFFRRLGRDGRPRGEIVPLGEAASSAEVVWDGAAHLVLATTPRGEGSTLAMHRVACE